MGILGQLQFNGGVSSSSNSNGNSANRNTNRPTSGDVDEKFFLGGDTPSLTGNQALDGGIVGLGLGALGATKVPSMGPSRARVTPVEEERGKPTLVEARHQEEEEEGSRRLMWTRGFSCLQGKAAPVIPMGGKEGKLLARMSLAQGS